MVKRIIPIAITLLCLSCETTKIYKPEFAGTTTYSKSETETFETHLTLNYRANLYEPENKKYLFYVNGKLITDYDIFGQTIKNQALTSFGIDF